MQVPIECADFNFYQYQQFMHTYLSDASGSAASSWIDHFDVILS